MRTLRGPILQRISIGLGLQIVRGSEKQSLKETVREIAVDVATTEAIIQTSRLLNKSLKKTGTKISFFDKGFRATKIGKAARGLSAIAKGAGYGGAFMLGGVIGAGAVTGGADVLETAGIISKSQASDAFDFGEQALYAFTLGSSGESPTQYKKEWANVWNMFAESFQNPELPRFLRGTGY